MSRARKIQGVSGRGSFGQRAQAASRRGALLFLVSADQFSERRYRRSPLLPVTRAKVPRVEIRAVQFFPPDGVVRARSVADVASADRWRARVAVKHVVASCQPRLLHGFLLVFLRERDLAIAAATSAACNQPSTRDSVS